MKKSIFLVLIFIIINVVLSQTHAQSILEANGPGNTYELINSILAPGGGDVVENPECVHPEFGRHITEVWDATLGKYVFAFHIHVTPDNDRCINFDRQRMEIKTYDASPANLKGTVGETVIYKWKFKIPSGFQPSSSFTHLHQIKAVGGDESDPIFVLTARKGSPNKLELNYYQSSDIAQDKLTSVDLSLFEGVWVDITERIYIKNSGGSYSITIKNNATQATILNYSNNNILTIRSDNNFIRPKWGIYRSLNTPSDLRNETVYFNSISIQEEQNTALENTNENKLNLSVSHNQNTLKITNSSNVTIREIQLYSGNGQLVKNLNSAKQAHAGSSEFDISDLRTGAYIAQIINNGDTISYKFIKLK